MVLEKSLDHLLRGVFKAGNDLFMHCFMYSYCDLFFFPSYLKGSSKNYECIENPVINKGSRAGMEVTWKHNLGINTEQTTDTTEQAEWNCWAEFWLGIFSLWMSESLSGISLENKMNASSKGLLTIRSCPGRWCRVNSCLQRIPVFL